MTNHGVTRVHYFERQFLRPQDFADEQAYHVAMRRRHNIAHHTWGIVFGLELIHQEGVFYALPGMAVDGYGRELILAHKTPLDRDAFANKGRDQLDVWLEYSRRGVGRSANGQAACDDEAETSIYRWQEAAAVRLEVAAPEGTDRRWPPGVPEGDRRFDATRTPPDAVPPAWPVFLGRIARDPANPEQFSVDADGRPEAGLVGASVRAPSGNTWLQIGAESEADQRGFAVFVPDPAPPATNPATPAPDPVRLEILRNGELVLHGPARLQGDLTLQGGAVEFGPGTACGQAAPSGQSAQNWRLYRCQTPAAGVTPATDELRIEIGAGADKQVVLGAWDPDQNQFVPYLTVTGDGQVTVQGTLVVMGQLIGIQPQP